MAITDITVNGVSLDLDEVEYSVNVRHGRNDIQSGQQPSDASIILRGFAGLPVDISDELYIEAYGQARFTGLVTDVTLTHETDTGKPRLELIAIGNLSKLGLLNVGESGYAEESLQLRVEDILDETGLDYQANTDPLMVQLAADPVDGGTAALTLLTDLCTATGATMADLPDGTILFESYSRRGYGYNPATWSQINDAWEDVTGIWADVYGRTEAAPIPVDLVDDVVIWEPVWRNTVTTVLNRVTVEYGDADPRDTITESDSPSIAKHGLRAYNLSTQLADLTDAFDRAGAIIRSQSEARYAMTNVQVLMHSASSGLRNDLLDVITGGRIQISNLPQPAPITTYMGVVEGWAETYTPGQHIWTVSLSDPRYSYALARWSEVDETLEWGDVNATIQWYNVAQASDLLAA